MLRDEALKAAAGIEKGRVSRLRSVDLREVPILVARDVVNVGVSRAGTREPPSHGCPPAILARLPTAIGLQIGDQPLPLFLRKPASLVENLFHSESGSTHKAELTLESWVESNHRRKPRSVWD